MPTFWALVSVHLTATISQAASKIPQFKVGQCESGRIGQRTHECAGGSNQRCQCGSPGRNAFGVAREMKNFIEVTLGTGLGSGIIVNGELVYGHDGFAGEMGHVIVEKNGRLCGCGRRGCLETYVSANGLRRTVFEMLANDNGLDEQSSLQNIPFNDLTSKMVYDAALEGDPIALKSFEYTGRILGEALADAVAYFSPEAIILFGGLAAAGDFIFIPTKKHMEKIFSLFTKIKSKYCLPVCRRAMPPF